MKGFLSSRQSLFLFFAFILLASAFALFYFNILDKNKSYLIQRNFRQLNYIESKIFQRARGLSNAIDYNTNKKIDSAALRQSFNDLITDISNSDITIAEKNTWQDKEEIQFEAYGNTLFLNLTKVSNNYRVRLQISGIEKILESKKKQELFDDIFLISSDGDSVLQVSSDLISISRLKTIRTIDGKDTLFSALSRYDAVAKLNTVNEDYILFIHPMKMLPGSTSVDNNKNKSTVYWTICGLISSSKLNSESRTFSTDVLLIYSALAILLALAWPLFKLRFVSPYSHIRVADLTIVSGAVLLGAAILTFIFIDTVVGNNRHSEIDQQLNNLSRKIRYNFVDELKQVGNALDSISKKFAGKLDSSHDIAYGLFLTEKDDKRVRAENVYANPKFLIDDDMYLFFNLIHWSDSLGKQKYKLPLQKKFTPVINIEKRNYFRRALNNNTGSYVLQLDNSLTTGDFELYFAKQVKLRETDSVKVGVVDFLPVSLYSAILPYGFSFCIINEDGTVLFHSIPERNLVENFFRECDNPRLAAAAVRAHSREIFTTNYWGKRSRIMISPFTDLPNAESWYLVVMADKAILNANNLETVAVSVFLFLIYIMPFVIVLFILLVKRGYHRILIWPDGAVLNVYKRVFTAFCLLSLVLTLIYFFVSDQTIIFLMSWLLPHSGILLAALALIQSLSVGQTLIKENKLALVAVTIMAADIILVLGFILYKFGTFNFDSVAALGAGIYIFLLLWIIVTLTGFVIIYYNHFPDKIKKIIPDIFFYIKKPFERIEAKKNSADSDYSDMASLKKTGFWYSMTFTALLVLGAILPAVGFFNATFKTQMKIYLKQAQVDYYKKLAEREGELNKKFVSNDYFISDTIKAELTNTFLDKYPYIFHQTLLDSSYHGSPATTWYDKGIVHESVYNIFRPFSREGIMGEALINDSPDSSYLWHADKSNIFLHNSKTDRVISSSVPGIGKYFPGQNFHILTIILISAGGIILLFIMVRNLCRWAFLLDADDSAFIVNQAVVNNPVRSNILLLSHKPGLAEDLLRDINKEPSDGNAVSIKISDVIVKRYTSDNKPQWTLTENYESLINGDIIILDAFETGHTNPDINSLKLSLLENILYSHKKRIIIISSVHPLGGFFCVDSAKGLEFRKDILNQWEDRLRGFVSLSWHYPCQQINDRSVVPIREFSEGLEINYEFRNDVVRIFHPEILLIADELEKIKEESTKVFLGVKTEITNSKFFDLAMEKTRSYHQHVWEQCSIDEKLVLVRLAQDKFLPYRNISTVEVLFRRGIIRRDPNIKPFNSIFTRFIREAGHPEEIYWKEQASQSGWRLFRFPILLVLSGIIIFIFSTQSELYSSTLAYLTAASALIPVVLRLLGIFQDKPATAKKSE